MLAIYCLSVFIHLLSAAAWFGGLMLLVVTGETNAAPPGFRATLLRTHRFWSWMSLVLLMATGTFNLSARGFSLADLWNGLVWQGPFGEVLAVKLGAVILVLGLSAARDLVRIDSDLTERLAGVVNVVLLLLGLAIFACAVMLIRGRPW